MKVEDEVINKVIDEVMKRLTLKDIPKHIWENVLEKWNTVEVWDDDLWRDCALCGYCSREGSPFFPCVYCPLPVTYPKNSTTAFCTSLRQESALCFKEGKSMETWQDNVKEFCSLVRGLIHNKKV